MEHSWSISLERKPPVISLEIPGDEPVVLDLYFKDVFTADYNIRTSAGAEYAKGNMATYRGIIQGNYNSVASLSVFDDDILIMFADNKGTVRVQQSDIDRYVKYKEVDMINVEPMECFTDDSDIPSVNIPGGKVGGTRSVGNCVEIYFECDYETYQDNNSSVTETEEWVAAIFNEVSIFYDNESVPIAISDILVWTESDPYASLNSTSSVLNEFVDQIATNGYVGRLAHLLSTRSLGGGIAYVDVLCSTSVPCAVSASLSTNVVPFPNYSWTITVVTHELGHNFGSRHTHRCVWNGNNTQIDDCGNEWANNAGNNPEGSSCYDETDPILPDAGGTIMSYCHLISGVGINFNNGFGPQPGELIYDNYIDASCSTGECGPPVCTQIANPAPGETDVETSSLITWQSTGANGYKITVGTSPGSGDIEDNLDVGSSLSYDPAGLPFNSTIYVKVVPYNTNGDASDCTEDNFTTEPGGEPSCTEIDSPGDGETDVDTEIVLTWPHSMGNQLGYKVNIGYTSGGGELVNDMDIGNVNSYDPEGLPFDTTLFVRITPYGAGGDASGCDIISFTTEEGLSGDLCSDALPISCGMTVNGSTLDASFDNMSYCGTSNTAPGVWFKFSGDGSNVVVSTCGAADYDTKLTVYRGVCGELTCVGGNDDISGCNYGSAVEFTAEVDWDYYILVHGWSSSIGDFYMTMACADPPLCPSEAILSDSFWISRVDFGSFSRQSGPGSDGDFQNEIIEVSQESSYGVTITPAFADEIYDQYYRIWIDYNEDGDFDDSGEEVFEAGPTDNPVSGTIVIPSSVNYGDKAMRITMKYGSHANPCQVFTWGEVEEYTLRVRCGMVTSTADSGIGSLRDALSCVSDGDTVRFSQAINGETIQLTSGPLVLNKDVVILANPQQDLTINGSATNRVFNVISQFDTEIHGLTLMGGTANNGSCIKNSGSLVLNQMVLKQPGGQSGRQLLNNVGELVLRGNCRIEDP